MVADKKIDFAILPLVAAIVFIDGTLLKRGDYGADYAKWYKSEQESGLEFFIRKRVSTFIKENASLALAEPNSQVTRNDSEKEFIIAV